MNFDCITRTHVGLRRKVNEDSLLERTDTGLWAVADGMGGHDAGEVASRMIAEALSNLPANGEPTALVADAIAVLMEVNRSLIDLAHSDLRARTIGSTVVGLAIGNGRYCCFWAGDSRAYRIRGNDIVPLTRDHSLVQDLVDTGMLNADEAEQHPDANVITRAVGAARELVVDTSEGEARPGDQFLLASDGLTKLVDDQGLLAELISGEPAEAGDRLIETVLARGAPDNVTLIITRVN